MQAKRDVVGLVIAGGRSTRFGGEKAVAPFAGRPLLLRAVDRLRDVARDVAVNARPGTAAAALAEAEGLVVLHDDAGDADGPLAGVKVGLRRALAQRATHLVVSPCDVPLAPASLFARLIDAAGEGAAMAETAEGRQPLCAVWPVAAYDAVVAALADGAHPPIWRLLDSLGAARVVHDDAAAFANLNTRDDLARLEASLTSDGTAR